MQQLDREKQKSRIWVTHKYVEVEGRAMKVSKREWREVDIG